MAQCRTPRAQPVLITPPNTQKPTDAYTRRTGPSEGNEPLLRQLLEYAIATYLPQLKEVEPDVERFGAFYRVGVLVGWLWWGGGCRWS